MEILSGVLSLHCVSSSHGDDRYGPNSLKISFSTIVDLVGFPYRPTIYSLESSRRNVDKITSSDETNDDVETRALGWLT
jgi:hypothetical protein